MRELLLRPEVRLLTLTGPGGVGKTRLGLHVAAELGSIFKDGVAFVTLAAVSDPDVVPATIAQALKVREVGGQPLLSTLKQQLSNKQQLLFLDNFEQVVAAAPLLADLLAACADLKLLVTSRMLLHLRGEREFIVAPLALPDARHLARLSSATLIQLPAVALFLERAQPVLSDFASTDEHLQAVAELCIALDGLPLAIELATARVKLFSPPQLLERLQHRLAVLTGGARDLPPRQQTLRATIDWSYQLLSADEQTLFARLAVFAGGWTLHAAEAICTTVGEQQIAVADELQALLDKSLVYRAVGSEDAPRFGMLETIREYAQEQLAQRGEGEPMRRQRLPTTRHSLSRRNRS